MKKKLKTFVKRNHFKMEGIGYVGFTSGWGNGYVVIPKGHIFYGLDYNELYDYVNAHGGLTFSEHTKNLDWDEVKGLNGWVVGFDTSHYMDDEITWSYNNVVSETADLVKQIQNFKPTIKQFVYLYYKRFAGVSNTFVHKHTRTLKKHAKSLETYVKSLINRFYKH